jgi:hypothetical protein
LTARYTGVAGVLSDTQSALDASGLRSRNVAGDALDLGVVETIEGNLVVGPKQPEFCTDRAGGAAVRSADDQQSKENADHQHAGSDNPNFLNLSPSSLQRKQCTDPAGTIAFILPCPRLCRKVQKG